VTFLGRSPDTATANEVRCFQVEQCDLGGPVPTMNAIVSALRFFFTQPLDRPDLARKLSVCGMRASCRSASSVRPFDGTDSSYRWRKKAGVTSSLQASFLKPFRGRSWMGRFLVRTGTIKPRPIAERVRHGGVLHGQPKALRAPSHRSATAWFRPKLSVNRAASNLPTNR
jgi:hypothetical protein